MEEKQKLAFLNLKNDHATLLLSPRLYRVYYPVFRALFGLTPEDEVYNVRKKWSGAEGEKSLTFAMRVGVDDPSESPEIKNTLIAVVEPTEPPNTPSHVRSMLTKHKTSALWQHLAFRTPDLFSLYEHMKKRGVNFITPIMKDEREDLIQVFTGELFCSGYSSSAVFFEFVERTLTDEVQKRLVEHNRETFFRDSTFLGLYDVKEKEYQSRHIVPLIDHELFLAIEAYVGKKEVWEISEKEIVFVEKIMLHYARKKAESFSAKK